MVLENGNKRIIYVHIAVQCSMVSYFRDELAVTGYIDVSESLRIIIFEDLDSEELLEVGDGGETRHPDVLPRHVPHLVRVRALQVEVDLLVKAVEVLASSSCLGLATRTSSLRTVLLILLLLLSLLLRLCLHILGTRQSSLLVEFSFSFVL